MDGSPLYFHKSQSSNKTLRCMKTAVTSVLSLVYRNANLEWITAECSSRASHFMLARVSLTTSTAAALCLLLLSYSSIKSRFTASNCQHEDHWLTQLQLTPRRHCTDCVVQFTSCRKCRRCRRCCLVVTRQACKVTSSAVNKVLKHAGGWLHLPVLHGTLQWQVGYIVLLMCV